MTTTMLANDPATEIEIPDDAPIGARLRAALEDYLFVGGHKMTPQQAAARLSVAVRTVVRYHATLRELGVLL